MMKECFALLVVFTTFAVIVLQMCAHNPTHYSYSESAMPDYSVGTKQNISPSSKQNNSAASPQGEPSSNSINHGSSGTFGYALTLSYLGQQSSGVRSLVSQQCMVGSLHLPMYVVEPFIRESIFEGFKRHQQDYVTHHTPSLKDHFDIDHYNAASKEKGWAQLAPWEDFVQHAPQKVVFVRLNVTVACQCMANDKPKFSSPTKVVWSASANDSCYNGQSLLKGIQKLPNGENLCIVRVIDATASPYIDLLAVEEVVFGQRKPHEVTLVFNRWCPSTYVQKSRVQCKAACENELGNLLHSSPKLLKHVQRYEMKFLKAASTNFKVAVMMRSEYIKLKDGCLNDIIKLSHQLQENSSSENVFVTADVGRYGSGSWTVNSPELAKWIQSVKNTVVTLLKGSLTFEEWEDTFTNVTAGITDRGYIAALQRMIASRADCLVLAGGGNFFILALYEYLDNHPQPSSWCIHFVCVAEKYKRRYDSLLSARDNNNY